MMNEPIFGVRRSKRRAAPALLLALGLAIIAGSAGCGRKKPSVDSPPVPTDRPLPTYRFSSGVRESHPDVARFVERFLETCLANDYAGYRRLVSRRIEPEARSRFERIYGAIRSVEVESIEKRQLRDLQVPVFVVVTAVELDPSQEEVRLRENSRRIAIIVFEEDGELRMAPAPPNLQPRSENASEAFPGDDPDDESRPVFPWDEGVDG